jgi:hypothetical protein
MQISAKSSACVAVFLLNNGTKDERSVATMPPSNSAAGYPKQHLPFFNDGKDKLREAFGEINVKGLAACCSGVMTI